MLILRWNDIVTDDLREKGWMIEEMTGDVGKKNRNAITRKEEGIEELVVTIFQHKFKYSINFIAIYSHVIINVILHGLS